MAEYIEREAISKLFDSECRGECVVCPYDDRGDCTLMNQIPAADVQPVVKARWVYTNMSRLVCSNCGNPVAFSLKEDGWHHGDFCPKCGARMDGET